MVQECVCNNKYQDERYGKKMRVKNSLPEKTDRPQEYRCTVCLKVS